VALAGLEPAELHATAERCARHSAARAWVADVTGLARMTEVAAEVGEHFGPPDIVVANAGIAIGGLFADSDPAAFSRVIEVNLLGSVTTARAFLPALASTGGYFLQIASLAAIVPAPLMSAYCASKAGVEAFAHSLRAEVAHQGVDVGVAYLTWTDTDMVRAADEDEVLSRLRAGMPGIAGRTAPLAPAVDRLVSGIGRRAPHIYAQRWTGIPAWLPRPLTAGATARAGARQVARVAQELRATAHLRRGPVGPGGRAASQPVKP
jgi:NAD(P)-dependent dehydrogenase (short-subunit alcohol dehydrogenase family)